LCPFRHHLFIVAAEDEQTGELRKAQAARAEAERRQAETSERPTEESQHRRRADKAGYLAEKLAERERSERD